MTDRIKQEVNDLFKNPSPKKRVGIVQLQMIKDGRCLYGLRRFRKAKEVVDMVRPLVEMADREMNLVLSLNARMEPLAVEIIAVGALNCIYLDVGNIFKHALLNNAAFVVCIHNHPSGDALPSRQDQDITKRLVKAGDLLGIALLDHIIIGDGDYYSFQSNGELERSEKAG